MSAQSSRPRSYLLVWAKYRLRDEHRYGDGFQDFLDYHAALRDALSDASSPDFAAVADTLHIFLRTCLRPIVCTTLEKAPYKNANALQGTAQEGILDCAIDIALRLALDSGGVEDDGEESQQGDGTTDHEMDDEDEDDDEVEDSGRVFEYCNILRLVLSPFNFLYRERQSSYMRTMPHLLPRCRRRVLSRVPELVEAALGKRWIGIGAFVGVLASVVYCEQEALRLAQNGGAASRRRRALQGDDDDPEEQAGGKQRVGPQADDAGTVASVGLRTGVHLLRLMQRLGRCTPEQLGIGTSQNDELQSVGRLLYNYSCNVGAFSDLPGEALSEAQREEEERRVGLFATAQHEWHVTVQRLLVTSNLKYRLFAANEFSLVARDVMRLPALVRTTFVQFVQSQGVLEQLLTNIDHRCLAKAEGLFVRLAGKGQLPLRILEALWAATANNNAHTIATIFNVLNSALSMVPPATLVQFIRVVDADLRGERQPAPLQQPKAASSQDTTAVKEVASSAKSIAVAGAFSSRTAEGLLGKQKRIARLIQARIAKTQPAFAGDPPVAIAPTVCDALLDLAWAPFDMLLRLRHPASLELVADSEEGRKVLDRFPSFYERFLQCLHPSQSPVQSAALDHFEICTKLLVSAAKAKPAKSSATVTAQGVSGGANAFDPTSTALLCAFMQRILRATPRRERESWLSIFQRVVSNSGGASSASARGSAARAAAASGVDSPSTVSASTPAGVVRRVFLGALTATAQTVVSDFDESGASQTKALQEATTALLALLDTVAPGEILEEDGALARELWEECLAPHPTLHSCFFDWILGQPVFVRRHFSAELNSFMFHTLCSVPADTFGLRSFACFRMFFLRINAARLPREEIAASSSSSYGGDHDDQTRSRLGPMRVKDRRLIGKEELFRLMVDGRSELRAAAISFYCSLLYAMAADGPSEKSLVLQEFEEIVLGRVLKEVLRVLPPSTASQNVSVPPEAQARLCRVLDLLREVLRCVAMPSVLTSHDPGPPTQLAQLAVKTQEWVGKKNNSRSSSNLYLPPMLFKQLGVRASDTLRTLQRRVLSVCHTYPEGAEAFQRLRLVFTDPRPRDAEGRLLSAKSSSSQSSKTRRQRGGGDDDPDGPGPTTSATTPVKKTSGDNRLTAGPPAKSASGKLGSDPTGSSQSKSKQSVARVPPPVLADLHSSLWTLGLDSAREIHARWEPRDDGGGGGGGALQQAAEDGLRDRRSDGELIHEDRIWILFVKDSQGLVPALLDVLEALQMQRDATDSFDRVALDVRIEHVWKFLMWLPTVSSVRSRFESPERLSTVDWDSELRVDQHFFRSVYSLQALRNVLLSHATRRRKKPDVAAEEAARDWQKLFVKSGCLAPTFRFFEHCDIGAMREQCVIRSCLDVTLTILLFIFGGGDAGGEEDDVSVKDVPPPLPAPGNDGSAAAAAPPPRIRLSGHIGGQSERTNGVFRLVDYEFQGARLWKKEQPENTSIHIFYVPGDQLWMVGQLTFSNGSRPDRCTKGYVHSIGAGNGSPVGLRFNFFSPNLGWLAALQAKCEPVPEETDETTSPSAAVEHKSLTAPGAISEKSKAKLKRHLSDGSFEIATAAVDVQAMVDQLLDFVLEISASSTDGDTNVLDAGMLDKALALLLSTIQVNERAKDCLVATLLKTADVFLNGAPLFYLLELATHVKGSSAMSRRLRAFFSTLSGCADMRNPILETCLHILTTRLKLESGDGDDWIDPLSPKRGGSNLEAVKRAGGNRSEDKAAPGDNTFFLILEEYLELDSANVMVVTRGATNKDGSSPQLAASGKGGSGWLSLTSFGGRLLEVAVRKIADHVNCIEQGQASGTSQMVLRHLFQLLTVLLQPPPGAAAPQAGTPQRGGEALQSGTPEEKNQMELLEQLVALTMEDCVFKLPSLEDRRRALCVSRGTQRAALQTMLTLGRRSNAFLAPLAIKLPCIIDPLQDALKPDVGDLRGDAGMPTRQWVVPVSDSPATGSSSATASSHIVGLKNQGNTCYMNSVLQQLFHVSAAFREELLRLGEMGATSGPKNEVGQAHAAEAVVAMATPVSATEAGSGAVAVVAEAVAAPEPAKEEVLRQLQRTFTYLSEGTMAYYDPVDFVDACTTFSTIENVYHQNDAGTFFSELFSRLETIVEDEGKRRKERLKVGEPVLDDNGADSFAASLRWHFSGRVINENIRVSGHTTSTLSPPTAIFSVPIRGIKTLQEALEQMFCVEEQMTGDSQLWCDKSNCKVDAVRSSSFKVLPNLLAIQLKRFDFCMQTFQEIKVNSRLEFPFDLDMFPYTQAARRQRDAKKKQREAEGQQQQAGAGGASKDKQFTPPVSPGKGPEGEEEEGKSSTDETSSPDFLNDKNGGMGDCTYKLKGVVIQSGAAGGGHYYSLVQTPDGWHCINDQLVSPFDVSRIPAECFGGRQDPTDAHECTHSAYILFYERNVPQDPPAQDEDEDKDDGGGGGGKDTPSVATVEGGGGASPVVDTVVAATEENSSKQATTDDAPEGGPDTSRRLNRPAAVGLEVVTTPPNGRRARVDSDGSKMPPCVPVNRFSAEVWQANTREERRRQLASPAVDAFLRRVLPLLPTLGRGSSSYFFERFAQHFVCNVLRFRRLRVGGVGGGGGRRVLTAQIDQWLDAFAQALEPGGLSQVLLPHLLLPLPRARPPGSAASDEPESRAPLLARCVARLLLDYDYSATTAREAVCRLLELCIMDGEKQAAARADASARHAASKGFAAAKVQALAAAPSMSHAAVQVFNFLVGLMPQAQASFLVLSKDHGFASLLGWVCTRGADLAHAPSFVAPPVLAIEALLGFLLGGEPAPPQVEGKEGSDRQTRSASGASSPPPPPPGRRRRSPPGQHLQDVRLTGRLIPWAQLLADAYQNRIINRPNKALSIPMPAITQAVEHLVAHPDFSRYAQLLAAHHASKSPPLLPHPAHTVLRSRRLVDVLLRQVMSHRSTSPTVPTEVFGILAKVLRCTPQFAASWGVGPLLLLHNKALDAVDEEPTDAAEQCYVQVLRTLYKRQEAARRAAGAEVDDVDDIPPLDPLDDAAAFLRVDIAEKIAGASMQSFASRAEGWQDHTSRANGTTSFNQLVQNAGFVARMLRVLLDAYEAAGQGLVDLLSVAMKHRLNDLADFSIEYLKHTEPGPEVMELRKRFNDFHGKLPPAQQRTSHPAHGARVDTRRSGQVDITSSDDDDVDGLSPDVSPKGHGQADVFSSEDLSDDDSFIDDLVGPAVENAVRRKQGVGESKDGSDGLEVDVLDAIEDFLDDDDEEEEEEEEEEDLNPRSEDAKVWVGIPQDASGGGALGYYPAEVLRWHAADPATNTPAVVEVFLHDGHGTFYEVPLSRVVTQESIAKSGRSMEWRGRSVDRGDPGDQGSGVRYGLAPGKSMLYWHEPPDEDEGTWLPVEVVSVDGPETSVLGPGHDGKPVLVPVDTTLLRKPQDKEVGSK